MQMDVVLTDASVGRLKAIDGKRTEYPVAGFTGLRLVVHPSGVKSWVYRTRLSGRVVKFTLGRHPEVRLPDAIVAARGIATDKAEGIDRRAVQRAEAEAKAAAEVAAAAAEEAAAVAVEVAASSTVAAIFERWMAEDQAENDSAKTVRRSVEKDVLPTLGSLPLREVTREQALAVIDAIYERGHATQARRVFSYMGRFLRWSLGESLIDASPLAGVDKHRRWGKEEERERVLEDDELADVLAAAEGLPWQYRDVIRLLALTGSRLSEMAELRWSEIKFAKGYIELPKARTKNDRGHVIPSAAALAILQKVPRTLGRDLVFSTTGTTPLGGWGKIKIRLDALIAERRGGVPLAGWVFHDLRRTMSTNMNGDHLGVEPHVVERCLNHVPPGVGRIYNRYQYLSNKRAALARWAEFVEAVVAVQPVAASASA